MRIGTGEPTRLSPVALEKLPEYFAEELEKALNEIGAKMLSNLRALYETVIHERPRNEGQDLRDVIMRGMTDYVERNGDVIELGVFNLSFVKETTHSESYGTANQHRSLFEILEEGYGPNDEWGWCPLELGMVLAEEALDKERVPKVSEDDQRATFLSYVAKKFQGRHGDGIMVKLEDPLFLRYPDFGTPLAHGIMPHAGWKGWHVFDNKGNLPADGGFNRLTGEVHWMTTAVSDAMTKAAKRVQGIK